jgi:hypothetical protein
MSYIAPDMVLSPRTMLSGLEVVYDGGELNWSLAKMIWNNEHRLGIRWNGNSDNPGGNPQSRGIATWFVLPQELEECSLNVANDLKMR